MVTMRRRSLAATLLALALALAAGGCGSIEPSEAGALPSAEPAGGPAAPGSAGATSGTGPVFPLTLHRTGGIAEYDDRVLLYADGSVLVETTTIHARECQLSEQQRTELLPLLGTLRLAGASQVPPPGQAGTGEPPTTGAPDTGDGESNDAIAITVTDDEQRIIDLSAPSLGTVASLVSSLVSDVTLTSPALTTCRPPAAPPSSGATSG